MSIPEHIPTADFHDERIALANWFPVIEDLDVPTPETHPLPLDHDREGMPGWDTEQAMEIVEDFGGEAFIRSDFKSAGHSLHAGSYINAPSEDIIDNTIAELISQHVMMQMPLGGQIYLREWLDLEWCMYSRHDLHPEVRVFIRDGEVVCHHPRNDWSDIDGPGSEFFDDAVNLIESAWDDTLQPYAKQIAEEFDDEWYSVDFVLTTNGNWFCTDMAIDALYERNGEWQGISDHSDQCEHNIETLAELNK